VCWSHAGTTDQRGRLAGQLKTHICHIRRKLGLPLDVPGAIRSLATVGYSLVKRRDRADTWPTIQPGTLTSAGDEQCIAV
jgi:hypothetical protein